MKIKYTPKYTPNEKDRAFKPGPYLYFDIIYGNPIQFPNLKDNAGWHIPRITLNVNDFSSRYSAIIRNFLYTISLRQAHHGIDIAAPEGTPVKATREGTVARIEWSDIYGNMIVIDHGGGMESLYGHLRGISVKVGYQVIAGKIIGSCGSTGQSTGPHLHFEIRKNGTSVDPASYLK